MELGTFAGQYSSATQLSCNPRYFHKINVWKKRCLKEVSWKVLWICLSCSVQMQLRLPVGEGSIFKTAVSLMYVSVQFLFVIAGTNVQGLVSIDNLSYFLWVKSLWKQQNISNAHKLLMLCSVQAGCRQLGELSVLLPLRVDTSKSCANRQDLVCPVCYRKTDVFLGWPEGHGVCSGMTAFSSSVPSPVLCLPSDLAMQSSWEDFSWQPCILWAMCSVTHLVVGLTLLQEEREQKAALQLLSAGPARWPWGKSPEELLSEGTAFYSRRMRCGCFLLYTSLFWRGLSMLCHDWRSSMYPFSAFASMGFYMRFSLVHVASSSASSWSSAFLLFPRTACILLPSGLQ